MPTVVINGKKHTPGSNTLKKMKRKAAMEAAAKAAAKAGKPAADKPKAKKAKAPVPRPRSDRPSKSRKPGDAREYSSFDKKSSSMAAVAPKPRARGDRPEVVKESPIPKGNDPSPGGNGSKKKRWVNEGNGMVRKMVYK
jgi:hypothetical protein